MGARWAARMDEEVAREARNAPIPARRACGRPSIFRVESKFNDNSSIPQSRLLARQLNEIVQMN